MFILYISYQIKIKINLVESTIPYLSSRLHPVPRPHLPTRNPNNPDQRPGLELLRLPAQHHRPPQRHRPQRPPEHLLVIRQIETLRHHRRRTDQGHQRPGLPTTAQVPPQRSNCGRTRSGIETLFG